MTDDSTLMTSYVRANAAIEWFNLMKDQKKMKITGDIDHKF